MTRPDDAWTLTVDRSDLGQTRRLSTPVPDLAPGEALLRVEKVGLTANNVTYAVLGEALRYSRRAGVGGRRREARADALEKVCHEVRSGRADPRTGHVITL
jgi:hypothetical protein